MHARRPVEPVPVSLVQALHARGCGIRLTLTLSLLGAAASNRVVASRRPGMRPGRGLPDTKKPAGANPDRLVRLR